MAADGRNDIDDALAVIGYRTLWQRISDWLFGYDFFISYRWSDGRVYALRLAEALKKERFDCFLDSDGFFKGDNWKSIGQRALRKTNRLVLVGSPEVHLSGLVARELRLFGRKGSCIMAIEFAGSLSPERYPESLILPHLDPDALREKEPPERLAVEPSDEVVRELRKSFRGTTAVIRRLRAIKAVAVALMLLTTGSVIFAFLAYREYRLNLASAAVTDAQRAASDADAGKFESAAAFFARSLSRNPQDPIVAGALLRLAIEQPPVAPQMLAAGSFIDARVSADGSTFLLLAEGGELSLCRASRQKALMDTGGRAVQALAVALNENAAAVAAGNEVARVDTASGQLGPWMRVAAPVTALGLHPADGRLACGCADGRVFLAGAAPGEWVERAPSLPGPVTELTFFQDSSLVAASRTRWQSWREDGTALFEPEPTGRSTTGVAFSPEGAVWEATPDPAELEGADASASVTAYADEQGWRSVADSPPWQRVEVAALAADARGRTCLCIFKSAEARVFGRLPDRDWEMPVPEVVAAALSSDGSMAVSAHRDGTLRRWDGELLSAMGAALPAPRGIRRILAGTDGARVIVIAAEGVHLYRFTPRAAADAPPTSPGTELSVLPPTFTHLTAGKHHCSRNGLRAVEVAQQPDTKREWIVQGPAHAARFRHPMSADDESRRDTVWENSKFKIMPLTLAAISGDGTTLLTAAGSQPVRVWDVCPGRQLGELQSPALPHRDRFPFLLALSNDGDRALVGYEQAGEVASHASLQLFDARRGTPLADPIPLYSGDQFWDVTPDLGSVLISTSDEVFVRDAEDWHTISGPVTLAQMVHSAAFAANGSAFVVAARDGRFRVWRASDAMPLCAATVFDPHAPHISGDPNDPYQATGWEECVTNGETILRRLAFRVEDPGDAPDAARTGPYRVFDFGLSATPSEYGRLGELVTALYGVRLTSSGAVSFSAPLSSVLIERAEWGPRAWKSDDARRASEWLMRDRLNRDTQPFTRPPH